LARRSDIPGRAGQYYRESTYPSRWHGKPPKPLRRSDFPRVTSPFLTITQPRWTVPIARQTGKPCSVATATSWSARSSKATLSPTRESGRVPSDKLRAKDGG
jgi:hypothetical protein